MNIGDLVTDAFPLWWPGAMVLVLVLVGALVLRKSWWPHVVVSAAAYSVLCLAMTFYTKHFFDQSSLLPYALALIAAVAFLLASYWERPRILLQLSGVIVLFAALTSGYGQLVPQGGTPREIHLEPTQEADCWNLGGWNLLGPGPNLVDEGERLLFGGVGMSKTVDAIGKAQCAACHTFHRGQSSKQAPTLYQLPQRINERFRATYREADPSLSLNKQAYAARLGKDTLEYIALSTVCHDCFVLPEWEKELRRAMSGKDLAKLNAVFMLSSDELTAIMAWLYFREGEMPPCPEEVDHTFRGMLALKLYWVEDEPKPIMISPLIEPPRFKTGPLVTGDEPIQEQFRKANCTNCHAIPGMTKDPRATGPALAMKTTGQRLRDRAYRGNATTVKEYIRESILDPSVYVVPPFQDNVMPKDYGQKLPAIAVEKMVNYLAQLEEGKEPPPITY